MKNDFFHLLQVKQEELATVCDLILSKAPVEMIVLSGSYALGEWVEDYRERHE